MNTHSHHERGVGRAAQAPTIREIAAVAARLRALTATGPDVDPAERTAFLADKAALLARIQRDTGAQYPVRASGASGNTQSSGNASTPTRCLR